MKILVIEDEPTSRKLANLVLTDGGHAVIDADSARGAIEAIIKDRPQIILLDLSLPGVDGFSLARQLKRDPETRNIPVVAITAYPEAFPREEALNAGCDAYLVKPIDTRKLVSQVEAVGREPK